MQLINQKEQLDAKISESKSINNANLLKLKEEIEKDGKFSIFQRKSCNVIVFTENDFKKLIRKSSERICSIAQLEEFEVDEMDEVQLKEMAENYFGESSFTLI